MCKMVSVKETPPPVIKRMMSVSGHLKQRDLLEGCQVDVHSDGGFHHQRHLVQQLGLIWRQRGYLCQKHFLDSPE